MTIFFDEKIFDIAQIVIYTNPLNEDGFLCLIEFNNNQGCILNISLNHITPKKSTQIRIAESVLKSAYESHVPIFFNGQPNEILLSIESLRIKSKNHSRKCLFLRCLNYIERELLQLLKLPPSLFSQCRRSISRNRLIYHSYSILPKIMFNSLFNQDMSTELQLVPVFQLRTTLKT